jgi:hypothetical protein
VYLPIAARNKSKYNELQKLLKERGLKTEQKKQKDHEH